MWAFTHRYTKVWARSSHPFIVNEKPALPLCTSCRALQIQQKPSYTTGGKLRKLQLYTNIL